MVYFSDTYTISIRKFKARGIKHFLHQHLKYIRRLIPFHFLVHRCEQLLADHEYGLQFSLHLDLDVLQLLAGRVKDRQRILARGLIQGLGQDQVTVCRGAALHVTGPPCRHDPLRVDPREVFIQCKCQASVVTAADQVSPAYRIKIDLIERLNTAIGRTQFYLLCGGLFQGIRAHDPHIRILFLRAGHDQTVLVRVIGQIIGMPQLLPLAAHLDQLPVGDPDLRDLDPAFRLPFSSPLRRSKAI